MLISAGADVNSRALDGWTPLHSAAAHSREPDVIAALIAAGADIDSQTRHKATPLHWAARQSRVPEVLAALLDAGADVQIKDVRGKTAWDYIQSNPDLMRTEAYRKLDELR